MSGEKQRGEAGITNLMFRTRRRPRNDLHLLKKGSLLFYLSVSSTADGAFVSRLPFFTNLQPFLEPNHNRDVALPGCVPVASVLVVFEVNVATKGTFYIIVCWASDQEDDLRSIT